MLVEVGRPVAPVPLVAHGRRRPSGRRAGFGTDEQKQHWLPGAASGVRLLTAAVAEDREFAARAADDDGRAVDGDGYRLTGSKALVPPGTRADLFLVPATTPVGRRASSWSSPATTA